MTTTFGIIIIGDEILSGKRADKHLPKAIELLGARGLQLGYAHYVGDDPARITATLAQAFDAAREHGDVLFSCGGIGATPDDHTRQCAAAALGVDLELHPEAKALITERMQDTAKEQGIAFDPDRHDNIHRLNMGVFPKGAEIIPNPYNKIPGFSCFVEPQRLASFGTSEQLAVSERGSEASRGTGFAGPQATAPSGGRELHAVSERGGEASRGTGFAGPQATAPSGGRELHAVSERGGIHFLPGFPVMAWPMMESVLDRLYPHLHQKSAWIEKSVIVSGSMEATLTPLMLDIEAAHPGVKVFSLPSVDHPVHGRHIELGVKGAPEAVAAAYPALLAGLAIFNLQLGPELVRG